VALSSAARSTGIVGGVSSDKVMPLRDRPSVVVKHVHADELLTQLEAVLPAKRFDTEGEAEELPPAGS
jgi:hypothetical protein